MLLIEDGNDFKSFSLELDGTESKMIEKRKEQWNMKSKLIVMSDKLAVDEEMEKKLKRLCWAR